MTLTTAKILAGRLETMTLTDGKGIGNWDANSSPAIHHSHLLCLQLLPHLNCPSTVDSPSVLLTGSSTENLTELPTDSPLSSPTCPPDQLEIELDLQLVSNQVLRFYPRHLQLKVQLAYRLSHHMDNHLALNHKSTRSPTRSPNDAPNENSKVALSILPVGTFSPTIDHALW
jgi:hypothetical protein